MDLVHGLLEWTTIGLPRMDHPEICDKHKLSNARTWTIKMRLINNHNYDHLRCNRFNPQLDLCHKALEDKTSGSRGRILASCPFAACVRAVGVQVRDKCDYICKISTCPCDFKHHVRRLIEVFESNDKKNIANSFGK